MAKFRNERIEPNIYRRHYTTAKGNVTTSLRLEMGIGSNNKKVLTINAPDTEASLIKLRKERLDFLNKKKANG
jgi:hypothetical protein